MTIAPIAPITTVSLTVSITDMAKSANLGNRAAHHYWAEANTWDHPTWSVAELEAAKRGRTVSVVLPALNEATTVAGVIDTIHPMLGGLVDELVVLDSGSVDDTAERAPGRRRDRDLPRGGGAGADAGAG